MSLIVKHVRVQNIPDVLKGNNYKVHVIVM